VIESLVIVGRIDRPELGLTPVAEALAAADVVIDFSTASAATALAAQCALAGVALVVGATGFEDDHLAAFAKAAKQIPVVRAGNYSLGVNMLMGLVRQAAAALGRPRTGMSRSSRPTIKPQDRRPVGHRPDAGRGRGARAAVVNLAEVADRVRDGITGPQGPLARSAFRSCAAAASSASTAWSSPAERDPDPIALGPRPGPVRARGPGRRASGSSRQAAGLYDMQDVLGFTR
jgi:4-hydroxy-tetrahydrodipicolinate reductase